MQDRLHGIRESRKYRTTLKQRKNAAASSPSGQGSRRRFSLFRVYLIKSVAVDGERFFVKTRFEKRGNTVCISRFSNRRIGGKDPSSAVGDLFRGSFISQASAPAQPASGSFCFRHRPQPMGAAAPRPAAAFRCRPRAGHAEHRPLTLCASHRRRQRKAS